ncbi:Ubiquitin carboxyl-terminal hydrolase 10 [Dermatophagoides farinae]|uniref:ubiquitinyl hydrolase 1 n=1 Tax=Dermatophagoides farinae TaxID=6954 RepID=A0A922IE76_DERFA|nr:Ubiquitin carboxyl-terminal hydrolase 10 [Dermatophagoides farinae]
MEFFDSTGISNEEAQALDVIKYESSGIEFLLNYNTHRLGQIISNNHNNFINSPNEHSKLSSSSSSFLMNGGDIQSTPPQPQPATLLHTPLSSSQNSTSTTTTTIATSNKTNHYHHHHHQQQQHLHQNNHSFESSHNHHHNNHHQNNNHFHHHQQQHPRFINHHHHHQNLNNEWDTTTTTPTKTAVTTSASNQHHHHHHHHEQQPPNSTVLVTNIAQSAGAAAPHGHPPHPYIFGAAHPAYYPHPPPPPPNHPYAIHTLPLGASQQPVHPTAAAAASVNQQHQRMPTMQNIGVHSSSNNKNSKNPSNVNSSPICDIRNSSNIYMSPQYSDATRQIIDVNQRLKNASVTGDQSGGNISDQILVSNGGSTATVAMPAHHLSSYANPYAFQPHALSFPHHFPHQPFYYVTSESFLQYQSIQPPQTHISPIPPVAHLINTSSSMNIPLTSTNQPPQLPASSSSSIPSAAMVTTTISSSSISTSSISSTSTTPYQNNTSGQETTVFDAQTRVSSSSSSSNNHEPNESSPSDLQLQKNRPMSTSDDKNSMIDQNVPSQSTIQDEVIKTNQNVSEKSSPETTDVNQASDYLKLCLNISDSSGKDDDNTTITKDSDQIETPAVIQNNNTVAANTELESITDDAAAEQFTNNKQSDPSSNKPTTWASRLFPTSITTGLNNIENQMANSNNNDGEESKVNVIQDISTTNSFVVTVSSELKSPSLQPNGDFPELNVIIKNHHSSNRRSGRSSNVHHDDNNLKNMTVIPIKNDPIAFKLAKRLRDNIHLKHSLPTIMPRGLINRGNWCYVNATMQALLACPPFYNLMREISETPGLFRQSTSTPIIDNFARYFVKFLPTDYKRQMKNVGNSYLEELLNTDPFEPTFIYDTLKHCGMIKNDAQRGHQEDAEEFLSSVLNGLNEEMIHLSKLLEETNDKISSVDKTNGFGLSNKSTSFDFELDDQLGLCHDVDDDDGVQDSSNDIWHEVGTTKHRSLPTRSAKIFSTSITEIFGGSTLDIRTVNKDKDSCGNRQPFFTLQLDIKPSSIKTLDDAIRWQTKSETIHGYTCSKTKQIVDASSQMFLENLPPILILHLKLFDYEIETGASKKLLKTIDFHENFEIPRECVTGKIDHRCRRYKLLAVVYHNGTEVINGHYITDVYHLGLNQWLRCDDSNIKVISLSKVLTGTEREGNLVPYLLFYRRYDTLHSNNSSSSSSSANNNNNSVQPNNSGSKRSINSHTGNEFGHNHNHHHHHHHHHHHNNDQQSISTKI